MFKLKPGNVFQKLNKMDKKQAYTWGAIVLVCFIALITLASFMGKADEASFEDFNTRGYDLAQMPFLNDEAEEYLLASKYPDMKDNNSTMLYSAAEKEARQEEDAAKAEAESSAQSEESYSSDGGYSRGGYSGGGYRGRGGGSGAPTEIGQLGSASMGRAGGSGVSATWGAPRGDFSTFKSQDKGTETPMAQLKNKDARRALSQFAQTSRAAAGLRDGKAANAKRALMGGHIEGSEAFTDNGIDLSKAQGLAIDPDGDFSSDFSGLQDAVKDAANAAKDAKDEFKEEAMDPLLQQLLSGLINLGVNALGNLINTGIDNMQANWAGNSALKDSSNGFADAALNATKWEDLSPDAQKMLTDTYGLNGENFKPGVSVSSQLAARRATPSGNNGNPATSSPTAPTSEPTLLDGQTTDPASPPEQNQEYSFSNKDRKDFRKEYRDYLKKNTNLDQSKQMFTAYNDARAVSLGRSSSNVNNRNTIYDIVGNSSLTNSQKVDSLMRNHGLSREAASVQVCGKQTC